MRVTVILTTEGDILPVAFTIALCRLEDMLSSELTVASDMTRSAPTGAEAALGASASATLDCPECGLKPEIPGR